MSTNAESFAKLRKTFFCVCVVFTGVIETVFNRIDHEIKVPSYDCMIGLNIVQLV